MCPKSDFSGLGLVLQAGVHAPAGVVFSLRWLLFLWAVLPKLCGMCCFGRVARAGVMVTLRMRLYCEIIRAGHDEPEQV